MKNHKKWIPFIIFIILCFLIFSKHGLIEVKAETFDFTNAFNSKTIRYYYYNNPNDKIFTNYSNTFSSNKDLFVKNSYSFEYLNGFRIEGSSSDFNNYITTHNSFYANVVIHFRFYYALDMTRQYNNYWNPFYAGEQWHESSSGSSHSGGGASFGEDNTGDYDILENEDSLYHIYIYGQKLDLYRFTEGFTDSTEGYTDVYAYYSKDISVSLPSSYYPLEFIHDLENDKTDYGRYPYNDTSKKSYFEFKLIEFSSTRNDVDFTSYYDSDSCLIDESCGFGLQDNSFLGYIKRIWNEIIDIPNKIITFFRDTFLNLLKSLFIPEDGFLDSIYQNIKSLFEQKFSILLVPYRALVELFNRFNNLSNINTNNFIINVPEFTIPGFNVPIINSTSYDLNNVLSNNTIHTLWILYLDFLDVFLIISFLNLTWNKLNSIIGAQIVENEIMTVTDNDVYDSSTGERLFGRINVSKSHTYNTRRRL